MFFDDSARALIAETSGIASFAPAGRGEPDRLIGSSENSRLAFRAQHINESRLKRLIDIAGSVALLIAFAPVMLMIAIAIRMETPGPVFFRQKRYGVGRDVFTLMKFRSMTVMESQGAFRQVSAGDKRITRVGAFLRRSSLDELPQLINVLKGEMSLVGPRPHAPAMDDAFGGTIRNYLDRHLVRPGLTGLAQIEGHRGPTDALDKIEKRLRCDRAYIRRWSPFYDIKILLLTPLRLLSPNAF
ncbi:sugar transferase [Kaistia dalseonensis]|uniref:Colanic acid biosynthesis UDP-glucose lipid carrier transferase n=1 Tax=Kaistia dalseonensis TaxID=410840 RepID=A0ABU0H329_9HYPH|nr:sugar transferase [Kaistia dalseonensis]MCX5494125.1 sugar transferase [Kaistia dalseonensis]MDQ0436704.1 putative colanic acid biosynthesis UDP-glucose lipid carrier transferase [Kaistia dalseonensis]